jgi:hypothetical protein
MPATRIATAIPNEKNVKAFIKIEGRNIITLKINNPI